MASAPTLVDSAQQSVPLTVEHGHTAAVSVYTPTPVDGLTLPPNRETLPPLSIDRALETPSAVDKPHKSGAFAHALARSVTPPSLGNNVLEPTRSSPTDECSSEPALSPREKAKVAKKRNPVTAETLFHLNQTTTAVQPSTGVTPFSDIAASQANVLNHTSVKDVDTLTVLASVEKHFVHLAGVLQGRQEGELLLDWLTLECEDESKAVSTIFLSSHKNILI